MKKLIFKAISAILVFSLLISGGVLSSAVQTPTDIPQGESKFIKPVTSLTEAPEGYTPIRTAAELDAIRNNLEGDYILMNDIDLASFGNWTPIGNEGSGFIGVFNGNGYAIKNMTIDATDNSDGDSHRTEKIGMFICNIYSGRFFNLGVEDALVTAKYSSSLEAGIIADSCGAVANCYVTGKIDVAATESISIGGITGTALYISYCRNEASVTAKSENSYVSCGGITGGYLRGKAYGCVNSGNISVSAPTSGVGASVGGIVGNGSCENCCNTADISVCINNTASVGGITGFAVSVDGCCNLGKISATSDSKLPEYSGALCGGIVSPLPLLYIDGETILNRIYDLFDALINGHNYYYIRNCCYLRDSLGVVGKTTIIPGTVSSCKAISADKINRQSSYSVLDFENVWTMSAEGVPTINDKFAPFKSEVSVSANSSAGIADSNAVHIIHGTSSNDDVAGVAATVINGYSEGTATIDFITSDGRYGKCSVTVGPAAEPEQPNIILRMIDAYYELIATLRNAVWLVTDKILGR